MYDQDPGFSATPANHMASARQTIASKTRRFNRTSAVLAFVVWGGWAYYVNSRPSQEISALPLRAGLIQGTASCLITLVMLRLVTWLYHQFCAYRLCIVLPALITTVVTGSCVTAAHLLAHTSNVFATVAPGMIVAFCFNIFAAYKLRQAERGML